MPASFAWQGTADCIRVPVRSTFALETLGAFGWKELWAHNDNLAAWGAQVVADALGVEPALPERCRGPMGLVPLPDGVS